MPSRCVPRALGRGSRIVLLVLATCGPTACRSFVELPPEPEAAAVSEGPLRWLMLPEEEKEARSLRSARDAADFLAAFWRRRGASKEAAEAAARTFYERVEAGDRLYADEETRGSLTKRGRALVLLGPPPVLRYGQRRVPAWEPSHPGTAGIRTRVLVVETWVYPIADLPPALAALLRERGMSEATLVFLLASKEAHLLDGERVLQLAVQASVRR
jgi:GWxTD domain-containing protein